MIGTHFWQFLLASDNMLLPVHPTTANGKTLIRLAVKSYSMDIPRSWQHVNLDPEEVLFESHKKKWDTVRDNSTLLGKYVLRTLPENKKRKNVVYKLSKAPPPAICVECKKRANASVATFAANSFPVPLRSSWRAQYTSMCIRSEKGTKRRGCFKKQLSTTLSRRR